VLDTLGDNYKHIDMDIDVPVSSNEVESGAITLRDHDICVNYYLPVVGELRKFCKSNKIDFITKDQDWLLAAVTSTIQEKPDAKSCYLGLPINRYHSNEEEINLKCVENVLRLFDAIKEEQK
jgi:putative aminopeptidase FrvX